MLLLFFMSCGEKEQDSSISTEETLVLPTSSCGIPEYSFLDTEEMGEIISINKREELSLTKEGLNILIDNFDLPLPPPQYDVQTFYVQYRSQDKGEEVLATGLISVPVRDDGALPIILWEHPTMGFSDECAPTAIGVVGAAYPILFASLGMAVVAPDYFGMSGWTGSSDSLHPYVIAEPTAISSLDALRALRDAVEKDWVDIEIDSQQVVIWGASEGGYASLVSDRYLPYYAPEFQSVATVAAIPATNPMSLAKHGVQQFGPTTAGILGAQVTMNQWYEAGLNLDNIMVPSLAAEVETMMANQCEEFSLFEEMEDVEEVFTPAYIGGVLAENLDPWTCFLKENSIVDLRVPVVATAPTLIITAEEDDLAIASAVHDDILPLCAMGYEIEHLQCAGIGHVKGALDTLGYQWTWIQTILNGGVPQNPCVVQEPVACAFD